MALKKYFTEAKGLLKGLSEKSADPDPIVQFTKWFSEAERAESRFPEAVTLSTVSLEGKPSARAVLMKGVDELGFRFFTNYDSRKGNELAANPAVVMSFLWKSLERQVIIEGTVSKLSREESNAYFQSRPRGSRIGAWASRQSQVLKDRKELEDRVEMFTKKFKGGEVPLPPNWGGFLLTPQRIEFWQGRISRLHDRIVYDRSGKSSNPWKISRLSP